MTFLLRILDTAPPGLHPEHIGRYLERFVDTEDGRGDIATTKDPQQALAFETPAEALDYWNQQSQTVPLRPTDGQPNRPLTAYSMMLVSLDPPAHQGLTIAAERVLRVRLMALPEEVLRETFGEVFKMPRLAAEADKGLLADYLLAYHPALAEDLVNRTAQFDKEG